MKKNQIYLIPTKFIDSDSPEIVKAAYEICGEETSDRGKAIKLYYAVRDGIYYDPYRIDLRPEGLKASTVWQKKYGFCISKAVLLAAFARVVGIPSRLGFADVKNHLTTNRLRDLMKSDVFAYHGYTELFLGNQWVKATPAFNLSLCERFFVNPLQFDGKKDSIFHEFDRNGNRHMEYIRDHGQFADLPYDQIVESFKEHYPILFSKKSKKIVGKFEEDVFTDRKVGDRKISG